MLHINKKSRPGKKRLSTKKIIIHYTGGNYRSLDELEKYLAGEHRFGGYTLAVDDVGIRLFAPLDEMTPHVGGELLDDYERIFGPTKMIDGYSIQNWHTLGICYIHQNWTGEPSKETYDVLVNVVASLCRQYGLSENDVDRHFDVTGKKCPKYYSESGALWTRFRQDVRKAIFERRHYVI